MLNKFSLPHLRKCIENSMENVHTYVKVQTFRCTFNNGIVLFLITTQRLWSCWWLSEYSTGNLYIWNEFYPIKSHKLMCTLCIVTLQCVINYIIIYIFTCVWKIIRSLLPKVQTNKINDPVVTRCQNWERFRRPAMELRGVTFLQSGFNRWYSYNINMENRNSGK